VGGGGGGGRGARARAAAAPAPLAEVGVFKLLDAFHAVLARAKEKPAFSIDSEGISIQQRITELVDLLRERRTCEFEALFESARSVNDVVVTFLAMLEMAKMRLLRIYQTDPEAPIHLEYRVLGQDEGAPGDDAAPAAAPTEESDDEREDHSV
jgi:segregation and condensation protein A